MRQNDESNHAAHDGSHAAEKKGGQINTDIIRKFSDLWDD
jgi:hypothetical protein